MRLFVFTILLPGAVTCSAGGDVFYPKFEMFRLG